MGPILIGGGVVVVLIIVFSAMAMSNNKSRPRRLGDGFEELPKR